MGRRWAAGAACAALLAEASAQRRSPVEVLQWAIDSLEPIQQGKVYEEHASPVLDDVWRQLQEVAPRLPKEPPWPLYLDRLRWDTAVLQRRHAEAVKLGRRLLENPTCLAEASQAVEHENCFPAVLRNLILECYRSGQTATARMVFQKFAGNHPRTSVYPLASQVTPDYIPRARPSKPFWSPNEIPLARVLEQHVDEIRRELAAVLKENGAFRQVRVSAFQEERDLEGFRRNTLQLCGPKLRSDRPPCWQEFNVYVAKDTGGVWSDERCALTPTLCRILQVPEVIGRLKRFDGAPQHDGVPGKAGFLRLMPNSRIISHTGPHNGRLTIHLGLKIPEDSHIQVDEERRSWEEGKALILDDSFVHHVANGDAAEDRLILLVHVWHPDLVEDLGYDSPDAARWRAAGAAARAEL